MFNLYFAGTGGKGCVDKIREKGCHQLLSQLNEKNQILKWVQYFKEHPECKSKLFIDSGAFSAHTKDKEVDVDSYIQFMNDIDQYVTIFAQVDTIPGKFGQPKTLEQLAEAPKLSWDNYLYMVGKVKSRDKLLPVFHQGEDFKWLKNMLEYKHSDGKHIDYIGISPANDVSVSLKKEWLAIVFSIIKRSSNPKVKTHAFGMTSLDVLENYPFTSADSTSWIMTGANGSLMTPGGSVTISDRQLNRLDHLYEKSAEKIQNITKHVEKYGYTLEQLMNDANARPLYHIDYLKDWADNYKMIGRNWYSKQLIDI